MMTNPIVTIEDNFFGDPYIVRRELSKLEFKNIVSPVDNVSYPGIAILQDWMDLYYLMELKLTGAVGREVKVNHMFARMMATGHNSPHKVHSDSSMGLYSAHVYLSRDWDYDSGTGFYSHKKHGPIESGPIDYADHTYLHPWDCYLFVRAKYNRLLVHHSDYFHMAEPSEGFGFDFNDARLVLTCFFDISLIKEGHDSKKER